MELEDILHLKKWQAFLDSKLSVFLLWEVMLKWPSFSKVIFFSCAFDTSLTHWLNRLPCLATVEVHIPGGLECGPQRQTEKTPYMKEGHLRIRCETTDLCLWKEALPIDNNLLTQDFTLHHMEKRIDPADGASYTFKDTPLAEKDLNSEIAWWQPSFGSRMDIHWHTTTPPSQSTS